VSPDLARTSSIGTLSRLPSESTLQPTPTFVAAAPRVVPGLLETSRIPTFAAPNPIVLPSPRSPLQSSVATVTMPSFTSVDVGQSRSLSRQGFSRGDALPRFGSSVALGTEQSSIRRLFAPALPSPRQTTAST
jgi:hypothetical protein